MGTYIAEFTNSIIGYSGLKFIIHSPTLAQILKNLKIKFPTKSEDDSFGDEHWYSVCDELMIKPPADMGEMRRWILAFFECYGHYPLERQTGDKKYPNLSEAKVKKLVSEIENNIDTILAETKDIFIATFEYDADSDELIGYVIRYKNDEMMVEDMDWSYLEEFCEEYGLEFDVVEDDDEY